MNLRINDLQGVYEHSSPVIREVRVDEKEVKMLHTNDRSCEWSLGESDGIMQLYLRERAFYTLQPGSTGNVLIWRSIYNANIVRWYKKDNGDDEQDDAPRLFNRERSRSRDRRREFVR